MLQQDYGKYLAKYKRVRLRKNKAIFIARNLFILFIYGYLLSASGPGFCYGYDFRQLRHDVVNSIVERVDVDFKGRYNKRS